MLNRLLIFLLFLAVPILAEAQTPQKTVLFEKITSAGCGGCAYGDFILDSLEANGVNVIPVHIHWHNATHIDSMTTADGDSILTDYLVLSPSGMIDRYKFDSLNWVPTSFLDGWEQLIQQRYLDSVYANVSGAARYDSASRTIEVDVSGEFLFSTSGDLRVNAYVLENGLLGAGPGWDQDNSFHTWAGHPMEGMGNPMTNYTHDHVLTYTLGGPWGEAGVIPGNVTAGDTFAHTFSRTIETDVDANQLEVVVLVQRYDADVEKREILNAAMVTIVPDTGLVDTTNNNVGQQEFAVNAFSLYPNPAQDEVRVDLSSPQHQFLLLTDLLGRERLRTNLVGRRSVALDISQLHRGIYLVSVFSEEGEQTTKRLVVR